MLEWQKKGLFCVRGGFFVDPRGPVEIAVTTHAHSDHVRPGSKRYYCERSGVSLLEHRLGARAGETEIIGVPYGEVFELGGVKLSFHPAGHILGSAQVRMEANGEVWVASGDYKRDPDPTCAPFEVVRCDGFVSETTFASPRYRWPEMEGEARSILDWWCANRAQGRNSLLFCYALGKTQRVLAELARLGCADRALLFGEAVALTELYRRGGVEMIPAYDVEGLPADERIRGELIVCSHAIRKSPVMKRLGSYETAFASGWMLEGGFGYASQFDRGFVISDHADWPDLLQTIRETGAKKVWLMDGAGKPFLKELGEMGLSVTLLQRGGVSERFRYHREPVQGDLFRPFVE